MKYNFNLEIGGIVLIQVKNISKRYGDHFAVKGISFHIERGKIYGLLGANGAGKSTTMNIITGCLSATDGQVTIDGKDILSEPIEAKKKIGYLPEIPPLYTEMTPLEYLTFVAEAKGVPPELTARQVKEALSLTGTDAVADRLIRNLSKGYKQRVGIAQALLGNPEVIILDEPTVGLDPKQMIEIRNLIKELGKTKTAIVSSHILSEISAICDHVMIISHGRLVANDSIKNLETSTNEERKLLLTVRGDEQKAISLLQALEGVTNLSPEVKNMTGTCRFSISFVEDNDPRETIFYTFAEHKMPIMDMTTNHVTLEDIFLRLTAEPFFEEEEPCENHLEETSDYIPQFTAEREEENE